VSPLARREFLGIAAAAPFALKASPRAPQNVIVLVLTGGPSQLDTWDPKPEAPSEIHSPFRAIRTNVPGIEISEVFPRMARHADKFALVRSVYNEAAPHGHEEATKPIDTATEGFLTLNGSFAANCRRARQLVEAGSPQHIRIDMFDSVFQRTTWDSHGYGPFSTLADYRDVVAPMFDAAYTSLLENLHQLGLLESALVIAAGEFGRTPRINPQGGRDHWTQCQTVLLAGGGIAGGQVIGSSDATAAEPKENPVSLGEIFAIAVGRENPEMPFRKLRLSL
jgi:uncharacterized protein (DUF1501 family)